MICKTPSLGNIFWWKQTLGVSEWDFLFDGKLSCLCIMFISWQKLMLGRSWGERSSLLSCLCAGEGGKRRGRGTVREFVQINASKRNIYTGLVRTEECAWERIKDMRWRSITSEQGGKHVLFPSYLSICEFPSDVCYFPSLAFHYVQLLLYFPFASVSPCSASAKSPFQTLFPYISFLPFPGLSDI